MGFVQFSMMREQGKIDIGQLSFIQKGIWQSGAVEQEAIKANKKIDQLGGWILLYGEEDYPETLSNIQNPPMVLFGRGNRALLNKIGLAVVGSRKAGQYARDLVNKMVPDWVQNGYCIISGMARGVDTMAHQAALNANGDTIAVLGTGVDIPYPKENAQLLEKIAQNGAVISEFLPGTEPRADQFPRRNRIISGLSKATVVVEADLRSGSLITAKMALESGREVFAIPGAITYPLSAGTNHLIQNLGAHMLLKSDDIGRVLDISGNWPSVNNQMSLPGMELDHPLLEYLPPQHSVALEDVIKQSNLPLQKVLILLMELEMQGAVQRLPGNRVIRR